MTSLDATVISPSPSVVTTDCFALRIPKDVSLENLPKAVKKILEDNAIKVISMTTLDEQTSVILRQDGRLISMSFSIQDADTRDVKFTMITK